MTSLFWIHIVRCTFTLSLCHSLSREHTHTQTHLSHLTHPFLLVSLSLSLLSSLTLSSSLSIPLPSSPAAIRHYFTWRLSLDLSESGEASLHRQPPLLRSLTLLEFLTFRIFGYICSVTPAAVFAERIGDRRIVHGASDDFRMIHL